MIFREGDAEDWEEWMSNFRESVYPTFEKHGFTLPEAVIHMQLNRIFNQLIDVEDVLTIPDDGEDWKNG